MSLYNAINGVSPLTFFLIPMLGDKHPEEYPRFRNVFIKAEKHPEYDNHIHVFTRVGGNNRGTGCGEEELENHPNFVTTFDYDFDTTYGTYVFSVPEKWKVDFDILVGSGELMSLSDELKAQVDKVFPKLAGKLPWHEQSNPEN